MAVSQQIIIDGMTKDWENVDPLYSDIGDYQGLDIETLQLSYSDKYLFVKINFNQEILLQQDNDILIGIDFDNNKSTGFDFGNIGAELVFNFGQRNGILNNGQGFLPIRHVEIGLITSPTVSSNEFEIAIERSFISSGIRFEMQDEIAIHISGEEDQGDQLPDSGTLVFSIDEDRVQQLPSYTLNKAIDTDFRIVSFNVLRDNVFQIGIRNSFKSIMSAVNADAYFFQEVYDHTDQELLALMDELNILDDQYEWYSSKQFPDLITISRFPIVHSQNIGSNSIAVLEVQDKELLVVNMHLPCCENDLGREIEIDQVLQFVRRSMEGETGYFLQENTPFIFCGDLNLVGRSSQLESLKNGDISDNDFFGPDVMLDWDDDGMSDLIPPTTGFPAVFTWFFNDSSFSPGRLDFIFYTDSRLEALNSFVLNSQGLDQNEQSMFQINDNSSLIASDHMPVVADFRFKAIDNYHELQELDLSIYPNPSQGIINLSVNESIASIYIMDIHGRQFMELTNPLSSVNLELPAGIYYLDIILTSGKRGRETIIVH